jgi:hypothetical protein
VWRSPPVLAGGTGSRYDRPDRFVGEADGMKKSAGPGGDSGGVAGSEIGEGWPADERGATWAGGRDQLAIGEGRRRVGAGGVDAGRKRGSQDRMVGRPGGGGWAARWLERIEEGIEGGRDLAASQSCMGWRNCGGRRPLRFGGGGGFGEGEGGEEGLSAVGGWLAVTQSWRIC